MYDDLSYASVLHGLGGLQQHYTLSALVCGYESGFHGMWLVPTTKQIESSGGCVVHSSSSAMTHCLSDVILFLGRPGSMFFANPFRLVCSGQGALHNSPISHRGLQESSFMSSGLLVK